MFAATCDFEEQTICGFNQAVGGDQFDWTLHSGSTTSTQTGPTNDHTYGTSQGKPPVYFICQ
jgi:hypothetical protein